MSDANSSIASIVKKILNQIGYSHIAILLVSACLFVTFSKQDNHIFVSASGYMLENFTILPNHIKRMVQSTHIPDLLAIKVDKDRTIYIYQKNLDQTHRFQVFVDYLNTTLNTIPLGEYLITLSDGFDDKWEWPIMAFASLQEIVDEAYVVLIPDFEAMIGYSKLFSRIDSNIGNYTWSQKLSKIFWRGSATGIHCNDQQNCYTRLSFMEYAKNKNYIDAGFVLIDPNYDAQYVQQVNNLSKRFPLKNYVRPGDSLAYKYLLDINGNSCSYSRMAWILYSNSILMKHVSNKVQWYYGKLKPNVHYLPISQDFSNLQAQFDWAEANPKLAQAIAENGRELAKEIFSKRAIRNATIESFIYYNEVVKWRLKPKK